MAAIDVLDSKWTAEIALISDTAVDAVRKAEATYCKDRYINALQKQASLENNEITSYTIGGRTFTRRNASEGQSVINELRNELSTLVWGTIVLADNNAEFDQPTER